MESTERILSEIIYALLEIDYRISKPSTQCIPLTSLLTVFVHNHPQTRLSKLILTEVMRGYLGNHLSILFESILGGKSDKRGLLASGSSAEIGLFVFPCRDIDIMLYYTNIKATSAARREFRDTEIMKILPDLDFPGFAYLMKENGEIFSHAELERRMITDDPILTKLKKHGPAWIMQNMQHGEYTYDFVPAVFCETWPPEAEPWKVRKRPSGWPSEAMVRDIVQDGCFVVPISHRNSINQGKQWRISFSKAELKLAKSLDISQKIVYHILKSLLAIFPTFSGNSPLSSYHLKTLLLWSCEKTPTYLWTKHNIVYNCQRLLKDAKECIISGKWPNYFIPENNISPRYCCESKFCFGCDSCGVPKIVLISFIDDLLSFERLCVEILKSGNICAYWYKPQLFQLFFGQRNLLPLSSILDFIRADIANYESLEKREFQKEVTLSLLSLLFFALRLIGESDNEYLLNENNFVTSISISDREQSKFGMNSVLLNIARGFYYYLRFIQSSKGSFEQNWKLHEMARKFFFRAINSLDPHVDMWWFSSMAIWCYFELAHNFRADISELMSHCDKAIEIFKSSKASATYAVFTQYLFGPRLVIPRNLFCVLDEVLVSVFGFFVLYEWTHNRLPGKKAVRLCFERAWFNSFLVVYFVKIRCLLQTYTGTTWKRFELLEFTDEYDELVRKYGTVMDRIAFKLCQAEVLNLSRRHRNKTRVY